MEFVDLFCGAGGLSRGLKEAGLKQRLAVDSDPDCIATYRSNFPRSRSICAEVQDLRPKDILGAVEDKNAFVLAGGPPCQLFSRLHQKRPNSGHVIFSYLKLVRLVRAPYLVFENVPQIRNYPRVWREFISTLQSAGYEIWHQIVNAADFGVPQARKRLIVIASRLGEIDPHVPKKTRITVSDAIGDLPEFDSSIANHVALGMSPQNRARIRSIRSPGGNSRFSVGFSDSYSRMHWDRPAPTITTRCISFSNGRFGHPEFDRGLTVREAARLQGFPDSHTFTGGVWVTARQVGNAVPPPLGRWLGRTILRHQRTIVDVK